MAKTGTTRLYWSERGAISCLADAPYRGTDTWIWERWRAMTAAEIEEFTTEVGRPPACECCGFGSDGTTRKGD